MNIIKTIFAALVACAVLISCETEDPGPLQEVTEEYALLDFDQIEMGNGFNIRVEESNTFLVKAEGDRRNINDLEVFKSGSTLIIRYDENSERNHQTYLTIQMPALRKANLSGGSVSVISGFESDGSLDFILSGGSVAQLDAGYRRLDLIVSGGSKLKLYGLGDELAADISGASSLSGFDYPVRQAEVVASGASTAGVTVSDNLTVNATGASIITYRGNPEVDNTISGGSAVHKD
jgi:hypothetical protein